ncbi:MAG: ribosome silencing factor [Flavobacteriaceae bacterium]|nr:ribosome silencing factor [Flavobacteriaceae bacterium]MCY4267353.1 ribosome silencing factor [Flavobacteriaceae bacterium]
MNDQQLVLQNELISTIIEAIDEIKGSDVILLDFRKIDNAPCRYFIVCNGTSTTHVRALESAIYRRCKKKLTQRPYDVEGRENAQWVLMDYIDVVVHLFQKEIREFYDLEGLWGDAKSITLSSSVQYGEKTK